MLPDAQTQVFIGGGCEWGCNRGAGHEATGVSLGAHKVQKHRFVTMETAAPQALSRVLGPSPPLLNHPSHHKVLDPYTLTGEQDITNDVPFQLKLSRHITHPLLPRLSHKQCNTTRAEIVILCDTIAILKHQEGIEGFPYFINFIR